jgi:hypothetical protein
MDLPSETLPVTRHSKVSVWHGLAQRAPDDTEMHRHLRSDDERVDGQR